MHVGRYEARRVDLKTLASVAKLYGKPRLSEELVRESNSTGARGAGLDPGAMVLRLREIGLPGMLCAADPNDPPFHVWEASQKGYTFLARMKGHAGQDDPFWAIAWYHGDGTIAVLQHMPADVDLCIPPPFWEAWTGIGIVINREIPENAPDYPQPNPN